MSIDEATRILHNFDGLSLTDEDELSEAIRKAIDIMRKYQKIVEILTSPDTKTVIQAFNNIVKVVADGKIE